MARNEQNQSGDDFIEKLVAVNRVAKVVKGGRRFSFSAVVVVGNREGLVGFGFGKANEVAEAIHRAVERAGGVDKTVLAVFMASASELETLMSGDVKLPVYAYPESAARALAAQKSQQGHDDDVEAGDEAALAGGGGDQAHLLQAGAHEEEQAGREAAAQIVGEQEANKLVFETPARIIGKAD